MLLISMQKFLLCILLCLSTQSQTFKFMLFKDKMQYKAQFIAKQMEDLYSRRCTSEMADCLIKSHNSCVGIAKTFCDKDYPKPDRCFGEGSLTSEKSAVKFLADIDYNQLSDDHKSMVCTTAHLEQSFKSIARDRNKQFARAYFSSYLGISRFYPGFYYGQKGKCDNFDPRARPWYTIAASGARHTMIMLDSSSHMLQDNKMTIGKQVSQAILSSLAYSDSISVLKFSDHATIIHDGNAKVATQQNIDSLTQTMWTIVPDGNTNILNAFSGSLSALNSSIQEQVIVPCHNTTTIVFLITDGNQLGENSSVQNIKNLIDSSQMKIILFIIAVGPSPNLSFLKELACAYRGDVIKINNQGKGNAQSQLVTKLQPFFQRLSVNSLIKSPIWTKPYDDFYGYGKMVTVSMPAYYSQQGKDYLQLLGVVGIDIMLKQFENLHSTEQQIRVYLIQQVSCFKDEMSECDLETFRNDDSFCAVSDCDNVPADNSFCLKYSEDLYLSAEVRSSRVCCGLLTAQFIIIMVIFSTILIVSLFLIYHRKNIMKYFRRLRKQRVKTLERIKKHRNHENQNYKTCQTFLKTEIAEKKIQQTSNSPENKEEVNFKAT